MLMFSKHMLNSDILGFRPGFDRVSVQGVRGRRKLPPIALEADSNETRTKLEQESIQNGR